MSIKALDFINNSTITEIGFKTAVGAGAMIGACLTGDWVGVRIFRFTHRSLMNSTPRMISEGLYQVFGRPLAPINLYFERKNPFFGRIVVAPILEEFVFRATQVFVLTRMLGLISRVALTSLAFTYAHNEAKPGKSVALLFIGIVLGSLAEWSENPVTGLVTAILAHSIFNAVIDRFYGQILGIGIK